MNFCFVLSQARSRAENILDTFLSVVVPQSIPGPESFVTQYTGFNLCELKCPNLFVVMLSLM